MKIINEEGYPAFTTRRLAKRVGITEPALYRHFKGKEDILINVIQELDKIWTETHSELERIKDPKKRICHFISAHFKYIERNPDILAVLFADEYIRLENNVQLKVSHMIDKRVEYLNTFLSTLLEGKIICGENARALTLIIMGSIRMAARNWRNKNYSYSLTKYGEDICCNLVNMLFKN